MRLHRLSSYLVHARSTISWHLAGNRPSGEAARVVEELRKNGIAVTTVENLGLSSDLIRELNQRCLALARAANTLSAEKTTNYKNYFFELLGRDPIQVRNDVFSRAALDPIVLSVASEYLNCYSRLNEYNVWLNIPVSGDPKASQLWHRDPGDSMILKMFLMISEITVENGAISYIPGTHRGGWRAALSPPYIHDGKAPRTLHEQMKQVVPESEWVTPVGGPGTVIFADTRGFHKGGLCLAGRRLLFNVMYTRWLYTYPTKLRVSDLGDLSDLCIARWATR